MTVLFVLNIELSMYNRDMNIALLEDDPTLAYGLKRHLNQRMHEVRVFSHLQSILDETETFDLYLIDVQLPDGLGFDFVRTLRKSSQAPVIYLSAQDDETSILRGFDLGGDDYLTKPFSLDELDRRILAISRRIQPHILTCGPLHVDLNVAQVRVDDVLIHLSTQEYRMIILLLNHKHQTVSHETMYDYLGLDPVYQENTMNVAVRRLRKKLGDRVQIESDHGIGYRLTE